MRRRAGGTACPAEAPPTPTGSASSGQRATGWAWNRPREGPGSGGSGQFSGYRPAAGQQAGFGRDDKADGGREETGILLGHLVCRTCLFGVISRGKPQNARQGR